MIEIPVTTIRVECSCGKWHTMAQSMKHEAQKRVPGIKRGYICMKANVAYVREWAE